MAKRGPKRDLDRELRYWELLSLGLGTVESCRRVGVARKTGYRWRAEMGGVIAKKPDSSGRYLSLFERQRLASLTAQGVGVRAIAARLGRSPSTVSRELSRNRRSWDSRYEPIVAHMRAHEQGRRPKAGKIESSPWPTTLIQSRSDKRWRVTSRRVV